MAFLRKALPIIWTSMHTWTWVITQQPVVVDQLVSLTGLESQSSQETCILNFIWIAAFMIVCNKKVSTLGPPPCPQIGALYTLVANERFWISKIQTNCKCNVCIFWISLFEYLLSHNLHWLGITKNIACETPWPV
jgi:hypothetical protein